MLIKNKDGEEVVNKENISRDGWREYFYKLLNVDWGSPKRNTMER